jgi:sporulation protein YlmC with PRC-barrel domain
MSTSPNRSPVESDTDADVITSLVDKEVYMQNGVFFGNIDDVKIDFDKKAITHLVFNRGSVNPDAFRLQSGKDGVILPYRWVRCAGDVILINEVATRDDHVRASMHSGTPADD